MATHFPPAWLDELRDRADIVAVIGEYVTLQQKGRNFWGLCPFHGEKTPSFSVDPQRQFYHCFGCKAGGSVIQFVMEMERMEFPEAVRHLADRVHMALPERTGSAEAYAAAKSQRETLYQINKQAATFFHQQLWLRENEEMLRYLYDRGLDDGTIRRFGIGCTAPGWDALTEHLIGQGFERDTLVRAGVSLKKEERYYDMFRQRCIFPIINAQGQVLGFGGRALGDIQPKYLNTSDTPVFNKRLGVYGIHLLRRQRNLPRVLLVEGYMDVVSLSQSGVSGVVATLGTALTPEQAKLLKRYAPQVHIAYDGDSAGQNAILRALDVLEAEDFPARVLVVPDGMDPDDYIRKQGREAFEALPPLLPVLYRMARAREKHDLSTQEGRTAYAIEAAALIARQREPVERENCLRQLMIETGFAREVLMDQIGASLPPETQAKAAARTPRRQRGPEEAEQGRHQRTLLYLLSAGLIDIQLVRAEDFDDPLYARLAVDILGGISPAALLESAADETERGQISGILETRPEGAEEFALDIAAGCLEKIRLSRISRQIENLTEQAARETDPAQRTIIYESIKGLLGDKKQLETGRKEG